MRLSYEIRIFLVLLLSTFLIFSSSHFGVLAFEGIISKSKVYPANTFIGSVEISGLEEKEGHQFLSNKIMEWQANSTFQLTYQEATITFPIDEFAFKVDESIQNVKAGLKNDLSIHIDSNSIRNAVNSLSTRFPINQVDLKRLTTDITTKANTLEIGSFEFNLDNYLLKSISKKQIINTVRIPIKNVELQNIAATLNLEPQSTFSLLSFLEKQGFTELETTSLGLMASGIYQVILPTNFQIFERHIGLVLPEGIKLGYEAKVDSELKWDLSVYNPNENAYKIEIFSEGEFLECNLIGSPFLYKYSINETELQELAPKTIIQYSPLMKAGQSKVTRNGKKGSYVEITRVIKGQDDVVIEKHEISKDYYPPFPKVQVFGITGSVQLEGNTISESSPEGTINNAISELTENPGYTQESNSVIESNKEDEENPLWGKTYEIDK